MSAKNEVNSFTYSILNDRRFLYGYFICFSCFLLVS